MKPLVIYHADCTDGFGAAFAAWLKLGDEAEYLPMLYGSDADLDALCLRSSFERREIYILDFSFSKPIMDQFFACGKRIIWLDHHKTAFEMWCGKYDRGMRWHELQGRSDEVFILLDDNKSGAMLAWEYFHPTTEIPMLIRHIDDRDRWQFKLQGSKELHAALQSMKPWSFEQWRIWLNAVVDGNALVGKEYAPGGYLFEEGSAILRAQDQNIASMAKQARECRIVPSVINSFDSYRDPCAWFHHEEFGDTCGARGLAVNANLHQSELGHVLATQSGTYGLIWCVAANGKVNCSLRSNGEYDVSAIAKAFGGGGHKNAAGFETDIDTLMGWLK